MTSARRASAFALAFSGAGVVLMLLLVVLAARTGPSGVIHGHAYDGSVREPSASVSHEPQRFTPPRPVTVHGTDAGDPVGGFLSVVGTVIAYVVAAYLLVLLWRAATRLPRALRDRKRRTTPPGGEIDVLDDPEPMLDEIRRDAYDQYELLLGGTPRNAIVACWDRFEEQAERVGAARRPWETSSEFTMRLLEAVDADGLAVRALELRYREARFSDHEITEADRGASLDALRAIHDSLGAPAGSRR